MTIIDELNRVMELEIATLNDVRAALDRFYVEAVELLFDCKGKVVVIGMGKSGLIAQKIAATMISTGTTAIYLHPSDGMHGDVGIIKGEDVVLAISKSGETEELLNVLLYVKSIGVPVISITANIESRLAVASQTVLLTPIKEEACPLNLAPTSSTTAALVVGDALAMALMVLRDFKPEHFAVLHPGGQLGRRLLMTVADIMRTGENNPAVSVDSKIQDMFYQITNKRSGAVSVVNDKQMLIGLVTDFDIRRVIEGGSDIFSMTIPEIMNKNPIYIHSDEKAVVALNLMEDREKPFMVLPVVDRETETVVGMVHLHDVVARGL